MIRYYLTVNGTISEIESPEPGCWISLTHPTASETELIASKYGIELNDLRAPLDEEERSRIETEDNYTVIVVDIPAIEERNGADWFVTLPLGIFVTEDVIISVCLQDTPVLSAGMNTAAAPAATAPKTNSMTRAAAMVFLPIKNIFSSAKRILSSNRVFCTFVCRKAHLSTEFSTKTFVCVENSAHFMHPRYYVYVSLNRRIRYFYSFFRA